MIVCTQALCEKLYRYAEWDFRNGRRLGDGASEGDHRKSAAAQFAKLGIKPKHDVVIPPPEFPHAIGHVWTWFTEVIRGVQGNGYSYPVITWTELDCWARLTRQEISPTDNRVYTGGTSYFPTRAYELSVRQPLSQTLLGSLLAQVNRSLLRCSHRSVVYFPLVRRWLACRLLACQSLGCRSRAYLS